MSVAIRCHHHLSSLRSHHHLYNLQSEILTLLSPTEQPDHTVIKAGKRFDILKEQAVSKHVLTEKAAFL